MNSGSSSVNSYRSGSKSVLVCIFSFFNSSGFGFGQCSKDVCVLVSSVKSVQQQDAGQYWCEVEFHDLTFSSQRAWITVEGEDDERNRGR